MVVLGTQHTDLKMDELAASVAEFMDEKAAKESGEGLEPGVTEEATSHSRAATTDVAETSTPPGATGETSHALDVDQPVETALLTDPPSS